MDLEGLSDVEHLKHFLFEMENAIEWIINRQNSYMVQEVLKEDDIKYRLQDEWKVCKKRLQYIIDKLDELKGDDWKSLELHGLTGSQLDLKIATFKSLLKRFNASASWVWIRRFLKFSDSILSSISIVFPGLGFVIEFKELIETLIKRRGKLPEQKG